MFTNTFSVTVTKVIVVASLMTLGFIAFANATYAATYAYVDASGDVKSVTAVDWKTAINVAPNIHINSGVILLNTAADYSVVGTSLTAY